MKCPYCGAEESKCVPDVVYRHAETYGGGGCNFTCRKCGNVIHVTAYVTVRVTGEQKTTEESDWPCLKYLK